MPLKSNGFFCFLPTLFPGFLKAELSFGFYNELLRFFAIPEAVS